MIDDKILRTIGENARERFNERVHEQGWPATTLGWDNESSMAIRFSVAMDRFDFTNGRVLEVCCGFGDFYDHLVKHGQPPEE